MPDRTDDDRADSIVISGAGMITPLGLTREQTWSAVLRGECGIGPLSAMEQTAS